jgi:conjugative transposon TraJ protein
LEREAMMRNPQTAWLVDDEAHRQRLSELGIFDIPEKISMWAERNAFQFRQNVQRWFHDLLEIIFKAAALIIDTLRTFFLIVLAILGPIAFAISVYDGFQSTLTQWMSRYVSIYMWLPVADLFSTILARIQVLMLQSDIYNLQHNPNHSIDASNVAFIVFMLIGIVGYMTIPTVANWIISAGGIGSYNRNLQSATGKAGTAVAAGAGAISGNIIGRIRKRKGS